MQKNKNASILIWGILMSLVLSFILVSISSKINLNLKQNSDIKKEIENNQKIEKNLKEIENIFKEIKKENFLINRENEVKTINNEIKLLQKNNQNQENDEKVFEKIEKIKELIGEKKFLEKIGEIEKFSKIDENIFIKIKKQETYALKENEKISFIIPTNTTIEIKVLSGNIFLKDDTNNFEIIGNHSYKTDNFFKKIFIENTGTYGKIDIIYDNYIISEKKDFEIYENFGNQKILKKDGTLKIN